uniref:Ribosomal protein S3 n=1 Tax=Herposiphonia versicolor TaxID=2007163 RepID=UPI0022FD9022|nr:Ribosomal protein S3 [Herposiphonia versicolor]WAX04179.1 Ribosomal protein S3 [Herposiphonia versicolor]
MTKKTNLTGKCLTLTTYWLNFFQNFENFYILYSKYFLISILFNSLLKKLVLFKKTNFFHQINFLVSSKKLIIILSVNSKHHFLMQIIKDFWFLIWLKNFSIFYLKLIVFSIKMFYLSKIFLEEYIFYLTNYFSFSPKKIFNMLNIFLLKNLNQESLSLSKRGIKIKRFIGFKIKLIGRYETSKNSMAKSVLIKSGKISSVSLKTCINFMNHYFYTKLGISNLKVWIFYSTNF